MVIIPSIALSTIAFNSASFSIAANLSQLILLIDCKVILIPVELNLKILNISILLPINSKNKQARFRSL
jgi:hypothetical protein